MGVNQAPSGRWRARVKMSGIEHWLGTHDTRDEAEQAVVLFKEQNRGHIEWQHQERVTRFTTYARSERGRARLRDVSQARKRERGRYVSGRDDQGAAESSEGIARG